MMVTPCFGKRAGRQKLDKPDLGFPVAFPEFKLEKMLTY
jgi:hypothetical protein